MLGTGALATSAGAAGTGYPMRFTAEGSHTFSGKPEALTPACPQALAGTPGSEPATKMLSPTNTAANFAPGGTVHYIYDDNARTNGGTQNFTIQDCVVAYAPGTFTSMDFDGNGVLINPKKNVLTGGTPLDGAALSGISSPAGDPITFGWTSPTTAMTPLATGTYVCNFARDIKNDHSGGGNRKVSPVCYQLGGGGPGTQFGGPPTIYLGYADDFTDVNGVRGPFTPTPWQGSPGVVFAGCTAGTPECGTYDAGAIRIDNNYTTASLQLTAASVDIGACKFAPWPAFLPATAAPGQKIILTQTGTFGPPQATPCDTDIPAAVRPLTNFDTSEPPGSAHSCSPAGGGEVPQIHLTFSDGTVLNLADAGRVLNTGGVDKASCFPGTDEGVQWTPLL